MTRKSSAPWTDHDLLRILDMRDGDALKARGHLAECRIARLASVIGGKP